MTGPEIAAMSDEELARRIQGTAVFARVRPEQKLRLVEAYKVEELRGAGGEVEGR